MVAGAKIRPSMGPGSMLEALKRQLSGMIPKPSHQQDSLVDVRKDISAPASDLKKDLTRERFVAKPGDIVEVKDATGKTWDIWEVISSPKSFSGGHAEVRSQRTGTRIRIPASMFELKKFKAEDGQEHEIVFNSDKYFSIRKDSDGTFTIMNVPIMECEARGHKLYDETYLDRVVTTYWSDKRSVSDRYGPGSEEHGFEPPVIVGHTSDEPLEKNDQREAIGTLSALWRKGKSLMANLSGITGEWLDRLRKGALPNRSCEVKVKASRIVALSLLSEEPFFHMPQMRHFSGEGTSGDSESIVFRHALKGDLSMENELTQLLEVFKQGAAIVESMIQNAAGGQMGGVTPPTTPPVQPAVGTPNEPPQRTDGTETHDASKDPKEVEADNKDAGGAGVQGAKTGDTAGIKPGVDNKGRPSETDSDQSGPLGEKPDDSKAVELSEKQTTIERLSAEVKDLGEKVQFSVKHIQQLTTEKRQVAFQSRLEAMAKDGIPIGGAEGVKSHIDVLSRLSEKEAEDYLTRLGKLPKLVMHREGGISPEASQSALDDQLAKYKADFNANPERFSNSGMSADDYAASQMLEELMPGGEEFDSDEEGAS